MGDGLVESVLFLAVPVDVLADQSVAGALFSQERNILLVKFLAAVGMRVVAIDVFDVPAVVIQSLTGALLEIESLVCAFRVPELMVL